jgi:predicted Zn-dependent protease with MMP-like domain
MVRLASRTAQRARHRRFHLMVQRVVDTLPPNVQALLKDVAIVVQDEPNQDQLADLDHREDSELFGLYQGIPMIDRSSSYTILPDRITIFAGPLSRTCESREELEEEIRITVLHELGHHLGYDEDGLDALGLS